MNGEGVRSSPVRSYPLVSAAFSSGSNCRQNFGIPGCASAQVVTSPPVPVSVGSVFAEYFVVDNHHCPHRSYRRCRGDDLYDDGVVRHPGPSIRAAARLSAGQFRASHQVIASPEMQECPHHAPDQRALRLRARVVAVSANGFAALWLADYLPGTIGRFHASRKSSSSSQAR